MSKEDRILTLVSTATGCVGTANVIILGIYITDRCLLLASLLPNFLTEATIVAIATLVSAAMLLCGSYLIYRGQGIRGGTLNIVAGVITIIIYAYFTVNREFPLLMQLGPVGYLLLIPAPISGILGILISRLKDLI